MDVYTSRRAVSYAQEWRAWNKSTVAILITTAALTSPRGCTSEDSHHRKQNTVWIRRGRVCQKLVVGWGTSAVSLRLFTGLKKHYPTNPRPTLLRLQDTCGSRSPYFITLPTAPRRTHGEARFVLEAQTPRQDSSTIVSQPGMRLRLLFVYSREHT